jgi:hypothetical protein
MRDGYVKSHQGVDGLACSFKRTANNLTPIKNELIATPESRAAFAELRAKQKSLKQARVAPAKLKQPKAKTTKSECTFCGRSVGKNKTGQLVTHKKPSGRYCAGGVQPTKEQRQIEKYRNAWRVIVPGGLPGLGKRR